ncbi:Berberine bridge enzyme-like 26 [Bienertia sinuspersici]
MSSVHSFPAGVCFTLGAGSHFSGGGYGNMLRQYGLSIDRIIDAQVVDAKGRLLNCETMGEDLFWAIRGGGVASFCSGTANNSTRIEQDSANFVHCAVSRMCQRSCSFDEQELPALGFTSTGLHQNAMD